MERMKVLMLAICMLVGITSLAYGANDAEPGSIDWGTVIPTTSFWYVDSSTNKPIAWSVKCLSATTNLIATHVQTDTNTGVDHYHFQYTFDGGGTPPRPTASKVNTFWNQRFGAYTKGTLDATNTYNCHIYGFKNSGGGGVYNYWTDSPGTIYGDDYVTVDSSNVQANDLLWYMSGDHTTVVTSVASQKPTGLKWKMHASGEYLYTPKSATAFNTPMCSGTVDTDTTIGQQPWTWTESFVSNPAVYRND